MRPAEETNARRDRVTQLTRQGHTAKQIADLLGVTKRTVARDRTATGCAQPKAPLLTQDELERAHAMLEDGASYDEVGRTLGRCSAGLRRKFPGYKLTRTDAAQRAALGRRMAQLMRGTK